MPQPKKDPSTRRRRNVASTAAVLTTETQPQDDAETAPAFPSLPARSEQEGPWHPAVVDLWDDVLRSPMAAEFHSSDLHQLVILMHLYQDFHTATSRTGRREAATEIRLQRQAFGLTPYDRRRLEWTIETAEGAKAQGRRRRNREDEATQQPPQGKPGDPRQSLRVV